MASHSSDTLPAVPARPVLTLLLGDVVRLRKAHPCGSERWRIDRLGADIGLRCLGCARHVLIDRVVLERRIVAFEERGNPAISSAVERGPRA